MRIDIYNHELLLIEIEYHHMNFSVTYQGLSGI